MKHLTLKLWMILSGIILAAASTNAMEVSEFKLDNGLTVILNPNPEASEVFGVVGVKAGSYNEPFEATGLAHYLEHVIFKGTQEMGTTNWEAEKPYYEKIIQRFEDLRATDDEEAKQAIIKDINQLSIEAGKYTVSNDFANLIQGIGGTNLNAGTSYDYTVFYNSFPSFQLERWVELYAHRFQNTVFRGFQAELENVYEEKNMYSDDPFSVLGEMYQEALFGKENPYGRSIIGYTDHLKNPSLKKLIEFYDTYYVPSNMVLVLSGKFDPAEAQPMIEKAFGQWENKTVPEPTVYPTKTFEGSEVVKVKSSPLPVSFWSYPTVAVGHKDETPLELMTEILSNGNQTGLLDKLALDGDLLQIVAYSDTRKYAGNVTIQAIPTFNMDLYKFNSISSAEKLINKQLEKLKAGDFEDWLLESVKAKLLMDFELMQESPSSAAMSLAQLFLNEEGLDYLDNYPAEVAAITKDDIVRVANTYLGDDYLQFYSLEGSTPKDKIKKPDIDPIVPSAGQKSKFAEYLQTVPMGELEEDFVAIGEDVKIGQLAEGVKLFYTPNPMNDIFSLDIKFGVGSQEIPAIGLATSLMNSAGIMALYEPQELKEEFSKLGCSYAFYNDDSYTYVSLQGKEANLEEACRLLAKLYLMPALDEKQFDRVLSSAISSRYTEKKTKDEQFSALVNYIRYGDNSPQLNRLSTDEIKALTISSLAAKFIEATHYETSVHYVGKMPLDEFKTVINRSLPFPAGLKDSPSPYVRPVTTPEERTIYFINNKEASQSDIILFAKGENYSLDQRPEFDAFNQYFSGGFNGLVMQELRELRSFAYSAGASYVSPQLPDHPAYFIGSIGTQKDKAADALREFLVLIDEMPEKPERMDNIKHYLEQAALSSKPNFRRLSANVEYWQTLGYSDDPNKTLIPRYKEMTFEDILTFYNAHLKGKDLSIAIVGNKKEIDMDALKAIAKIQNVSASKLFKD